MASPVTQPEIAKGSPVSSREKRQPWQSQMSDVDFQLSLLAKYAGIEFHPHVLEIILDLIRMNVSIPMLAKMIKLMCAQKAVATTQPSSSGNNQNGNSNGGIHSIPSMESYRTLIVSSSSESTSSTSHSNSNTNSHSSSSKNADFSTPLNRTVKNPSHSLVTTRATRTKTASRILKK